MESQQNSNTLNELYTALCKVQGILNPAEKGKTAGQGSYKYTYADLPAVISAAQEALEKNGLCFTTRIESEQGNTLFFARLAHGSGQYLESKIEVGISLTDIKSIQDLGKVITYLRRYTFSMMVGIVTEEDDDAQSIVSSKNTYTQIPKQPAKAIEPKIVEYISADQLEILEHELENNLDIAKAIIEKYGGLSMMPRNQFQASLDRIRELKRLKDKK